LAGLVAVPTHLVSRPALNPDFTHFESGQVHPVALTPDGNRLLVVNTPDSRLSVFDLTGVAPVRIAEIPVGLEPVSVAARDDGEAWVVNHLSDDVSIVDLATFHTRATLHVGDEPSDVVFAGSPPRAYVSVSQEDAVKVYDPTNLAIAPTVIPIPGRMPRALARSPDGAQVLVGVFQSSAQATTLSAAEAGDSLPPPSPPLAGGLPPSPRTGLVVRRSNGHWTDSSGHLWDSKIPYSLPAVEVVYLNTATNAVMATHGDIASILLGMAIDPVTGAAAVTGTHAALEIRLEPNLRGRMTEQRLAVLPAHDQVPRPIALNPHIDYSVTPGPPSEADSALGMPTGVCWSADGARVFVTSLATDKIGVIDPGGTGSVVARVPVVAGPTGVIADPQRPRLYVVGRFHNQLQTLTTEDFSTVALTSIGFDPTPDEIVNGRKFFYGGFTSGHGDQSCASCHLFGDSDQFAWELGDPQGAMAPKPPGMIDPLLQSFHPMKGPMVTQSLRGLIGTGVLHWRGDRASLATFNPAFVSLMGRTSQLPDSEMAAFSDFVLPLVYPPNPHQLLDRSFLDAPPGQPSAQRGRTFFMSAPSFNSVVFDQFKCVDCHALPTGTNGQMIHANALLAPQDMKIPHLRNLYKKTGFMDSVGVVSKRGFGFTHDGSVDRLLSFLRSPVFDFGAPEPVADASRRDVESFLLAFDTGTPPAVGAQVTFDGTIKYEPALDARLDTLEAQADAGACDLIAKGRVGTTPRGWLYEGGGGWRPDRAGDASITSDQLVALATSGSALTVTGVPPGSGHRMALDRDRDGFLDGDELAGGFDPGDPYSNPRLVVDSRGTVSSTLLRIAPNPFGTRTTIEYVLAREGPVLLTVFDLLGRRVRVLADHPRGSAGDHAVAWDGRTDAGASVGAGVYFVRLEADDRVRTRAVMRLR
jgi:YVTN family beta-propeller protein